MSLVVFSILKQVSSYFTCFGECCMMFCCEAPGTFLWTMKLHLTQKINELFPQVDVLLKLHDSFAFKVTADAKLQ